MSNLYYNQKWEEAIGDLLQQISLENQPLEEFNEKGHSFKRTDYQWFQFYAALYIKYIDCYRKLEDCYDQLVHPQKRQLLKVMLDNTMLRLCQVKANLVKYNTHTLIIQSDFINLDEIIMDMKLTPQALDVPIPRYFCQVDKLKGSKTQDGEIANPQVRNNLVTKFMMEYHDTAEPQQELLQNKCVINLDEHHLIRMIQNIERGRQGIQRCKLVKFYQKESQKRNNKALIMQAKQEEENTQTTSAVVVVQSYFRAYLARKQLYETRKQQLIFLGMYRPSESASEKQQKQKALIKRMKMKIKQEQFKIKYVSDMIQLKHEVQQTEGPDIKQKLLDDRRKWIQGTPQLPKKATQFYQKDKIQETKPADQKKGAKKQQKSPKKASKGKGKKTGIEQFLQDHEKVGPSEIVIKIQENIQKHDVQWGKRDQTDNFQQNYVVDVARQIIRPQVQQTVKKTVDDLIDIQLDNLRVKYGIKKKNKKQKKKKPPKTKKVKIPQNLGKKQPQLLLQELVQFNIVKKLKPAFLKDLLGDQNPLGSLIQKHSQLMPDPSMAQIRNLVTQLIAIPLGSSFVRQNLQQKNSWFLFYGPMGSGKTLVYRALAHQCNALVFDLSISNLQGKFNDKTAWTKLIWMVIICAQKYQPSIIFIDDFQQIFPVKKKKGAASIITCGPKFKKPLSDMKKNKLWTSKDCIAVIGCTNKPYEGSLKEMKKLFDRKIYFPYPNYATRKMIIRKFIQEKGIQIPQNFHISNFSHITEGFTGGSVFSLQVSSCNRQSPHSSQAQTNQLGSAQIGRVHLAYFQYLLHLQPIIRKIQGFLRRSHRVKITQIEATELLKSRKRRQKRCKERSQKEKMIQGETLHFESHSFYFISQCFFPYVLDRIMLHPLKYVLQELFESCYFADFNQCDSRLNCSYPEQIICATKYFIKPFLYNFLKPYQISDRKNSLYEKNRLPSDLVSLVLQQIENQVYLIDSQNTISDGVQQFVQHLYYIESYSPAFILKKTPQDAIAQIPQVIQLNST